MDERGLHQKNECYDGLNRDKNKIRPIYTVNHKNVTFYF